MGEGWHARAPVVAGPDPSQKVAPILAGTLMTHPPSPNAPVRLVPAGLMFLAITSVGWGFNWPVTKYLLSELPVLTFRGVTGIIGAALLAAIALAMGQSLRVARNLWPRLMLAALLNVTGWMVLMGLALLWLPASEAALIAYTMPICGGIDRARVFARID